jgi:ubiquitin carboxyl-terminal hydrolase 5/13
MDVVSVTVPAKEKGKDDKGQYIYQEVRLFDCLDSLLSLEALEYSCSSCSRNVQALKYVGITLQTTYFSDLFYQTN